MRRVARLRIVMTYRGSYLWRLRQSIGHDLVLMPGAMIALQRGDGRILLTKRSDDGSWCLPAGAAEPGGSFVRTAIDELAEETGIKVVEADLVPFGCLSEAEAHTIHYPNGDVTHCFALLFLATAWQGDASPSEEATDAKFVDLATPPEPLHAPTGHALELLRSHLDSGAFQVR
jgi:8-oxo-dGTP pyrophosphatase MutT (NUDIX family)